MLWLTIAAASYQPTKLAGDAHRKFSQNHENLKGFLTGLEGGQVSPQKYAAQRGASADSGFHRDESGRRD